ncbi:MAG: hypothetical protein ACJ78L_07700, partial [Chloroflexota bacterium]
GRDGRSPRLRELGRFVGRPPGANDSQATAVATPPVAATPQATPAQTTATTSKAPASPGTTASDGDEVHSSVAARAPR